MGWVMNWVGLRRRFFRLFFVVIAVLPMRLWGDTSTYEEGAVSFPPRMSQIWNF